MARQWPSTRHLSKAEANRLNADFRHVAGPSLAPGVWNLADREFKRLCYNIEALKILAELDANVIVFTSPSAARWDNYRKGGA